MNIFTRATATSRIVSALGSLAMLMAAVTTLIGTSSSLADNYTINWLQHAPIVPGSPIPTPSEFTLPGVGRVRMYHQEVPSPSGQFTWTLSSGGTFNTGSVTTTIPPATYSWTGFEYLTSVNSGPAGSTRTWFVAYDFLDGPVAPSRLVLGTLGLGRNDLPFPGNITVASCRQNGTLLGEFGVDSSTFGPSTFTPDEDNDGVFQLFNNGLPGPCNSSTNPRCFNTALAIVRIDGISNQPVSSLEVLFEHIGNDGIGVSIGYINPPTGACCTANTCVLRDAPNCPGAFFSNTFCSPNVCEPGLYCACCDPVSGVCLAITREACTSMSGTYTGNVGCTPLLCDLLRSCCVGVLCQLTPVKLCGDAGGVYSWRSTCSPNPCVGATGACCGLCPCTITTGLACTGIYQGDGTTCAPDPCVPMFGKCCIADICVSTTAANCTGTWTPGGSCSPNPCCPVGWTQQMVTGPSPRSSLQMAYDSARGVTVLFGGSNLVSGGFAFDGQTWEWNATGGGGAGAWTQRLVSGPSPRYAHAMAYDSARGVTVLFGGYLGNNVYSGETWEWNGTAWMQRLVSGPTPRYLHAMAYDAARGVTVLFGGVSDVANYGETWEWNGTVWTQRLVNGPSPRYGHAMAYDSARGITVLFGGGSIGFNGETWEWNGTAWMQRLVSGPTPRYLHAMAYDEAHGVTVLFGGSNDVTSSGETWEWNGTGGGGGGAWTQRAVNGPTPRHSHAMVYDSARGVNVLFGGQPSGMFFNGETWMLGAACSSTTGACCDASGTCSISTLNNCSGIYQGDFSTCSPNVCPQPTGACCCGSTCAITTPAACTGTNVSFAGTNTVCNIGAVNNTSPCCFADYNHSSIVGVQDIFDFLAGYFSDDPCANINGGATSVQDIFDFLAAYFAGC